MTGKYLNRHYVLKFIITIINFISLFALLSILHHIFMYSIMKRLFGTIIFYCCIGSIHAQTLQDSHYTNSGYINADGTIQDGHYATVGYFKTDGTVQDSHYSTIGYAKNGTIQDSHYNTLGYVKSDGTVQDSHYSTIGYIKSDGTIQDSHYSTIGYAKGINMAWAATYFFFFHFD